MLHPDTPVALPYGVGIGPVDGVELLALTAKLRKTGDRYIEAHHGIPCRAPHDTVRCQIENFLKPDHRRFCLSAEDAIHQGYFGNGGIVLGNSVEHDLQDHNAGAGIAPAQDTGIGRCDSLHRGVADDFHVPIVAAQDFRSSIALLGQILAAPLAETLTGHGGAVAEFCRQRLHKAGPTQIAGVQLIRQPGDVFKIAAPLDKELVICCGIGNIEIISPASVELRVDPVQSEGNDGEYICS